MSLVRPYDIQALEQPEQLSDGVPRTFVYLFAIDEQQRTYVVRLDDFYTYIYIELPPFDTRGDEIDWNDGLVDRFVGSFRGKMNSTIVDYQLVDGKRLYYYQPNERQFVKISLTSQSTREVHNLARRLESTYGFLDTTTQLGT